MKADILFFIILFLFVIALPATAQLDSSKLFWPEDIVYKGAFKLPPKVGDYKWGYGSGAMTYVPTGDPAGPNDGYPGSLYGVGSVVQNRVSEIAIPEPVISPTQDYNALNMAATLQPFSDITGGLLGQDQGGATPDRLGGLCYLPAQGQQQSGKIYWAIYKFYYVMSDDNFGIGWSDLSLSSPQAKGLWHVGNYHSHHTTDYLFEIPKAWADQYTPGKYIMSGRARGSGRGSSSDGPSFHAMGPYNDGNPPADRTNLDAVRLAFYEPQGDQWSDDYNNKDTYFGGVWLTAGNKSSLIVTSSKGSTANYCYGSAADCGDLCGGGKGSHAYPYEAQLLFYDPAELAKSAQAQIEPHEVKPYHIMSNEDMLWSRCQTAPEAIAYDRERGNIYVFQGGLGEKPVIHVWSIAGQLTVTNQNKDPNIGGKMDVRVSPNPFSTSVKIRALVRNDECGVMNINAGIFDINGRLITRFDQFRIPHSAFGISYNWDASDHPPGIYLLKVRTGNRIITKKLMLAR
jgi:hypothetical protein